jgi:hypothetical protein
MPLVTRWRESHPVPSFQGFASCPNAYTVQCAHAACISAPFSHPTTPYPLRGQLRGQCGARGSGDTGGLFRPSVSRPLLSFLLHVDAPAAGGDSRGEARGSGGSLVAGTARV